MKALTRQESEAWAKAHGYDLDYASLPALRSADQLTSFVIPEDAGKRVALVRGDMRAFSSEREVCIWIHDWNVWPSGQWAHLFDQFRRAYGIFDTFEQRPCHVISNQDFDASISIAVYSVLMLWDCHILASSGLPYLYYSHDEFGRKR